MESLLLRGLEPTLRYWLKSFARDQFRLRGRSIQLYDLDLDGDVLHASIGLPPTLRVTEARVSMMELKINSFTNVNREPIVVEIDRLELVISEKSSDDLGYIPGTLPKDYNGESSGYGYSDKLADGMTVRMGMVNLILETKGGTRKDGIRSHEVASITMRNLELCTTNEHWQIVPLNQARDFSINRRAIYVFKKLVWESLSVDLLPAKIDYAQRHSTHDFNSDYDGTKRIWRGERILDNVAGSAHITIKRTELNRPHGLEVQLLMPEILCPTLSEPGGKSLFNVGLQALLRFMNRLVVCLNREDANSRSPQTSNEAGKTLISVMVDHIFLNVKDSDELWSYEGYTDFKAISHTEFQWEFVMQSLHYMRWSIVDGIFTRTMAQLIVGYLFFRDTFSRPSYTLIQPSMRDSGSNIRMPVPSFASEKLWPRIHPYDGELMPRSETPPMLSIYSSQTMPSPAAPTLASQIVIQCQPLKINLQESTCLRLATILADCIVVESAVALPDSSLHAMYFTIKEFDLVVPVNEVLVDEGIGEGPFTGARLRVEGFMMARSPFLNFRMLNIDNDPACYSMWKGQPVESNHQRWVGRASHMAIALETKSCDDSAQMMSNTEADWASDLWRCVEMSDLGVEAAMVSADGCPLMTFFPVGGTVRLGLSCKKCVANLSEEQYLYLMKMYRIVGKAVDNVSYASKSVALKGIQIMDDLTRKDFTKELQEMAPNDTAVILSLNALELKLLASGRIARESPPLVKLLSWDITLSATHKSLGGATMVTSKVLWQDVRIECVQPKVSNGDTDPLKCTTEMKYVASDDAVLRSPESSYTSSGSSSPDTSLERQPPHTVASPAQEQFVKSHEGNHSSEDSPEMCAVIWIGKDRGSMAPMKREAGGEEYYSPQAPFLDITVESLIPHRAQETDSHNLKVVAKVGGVRFGGSMCQSESLLYRYGMFGPDGTPADKIKQVAWILSNGPLSTLLRPSPASAEGGLATEVSEYPIWEVDMFDEVDMDLQLLDWLFALEGVEYSAEPMKSSLKQTDSIPRSEGCWYSTFRCLQIKSRGTKASRMSAAREFGSKPKTVQDVTLRIEGLQAVKPGSPATSPTPVVGGGYVTDLGKEETILTTATPSNNIDNETPDEPVRKVRRLLNTLPNVTSTSGLDMEVHLVGRGKEVDTVMGIGDWILHSFRAGVREPGEFGGTRQELEGLVKLCKAEIEAASRIAICALKLFKIESAIPESAVEHLSDLGSGRLESALAPELGNYDKKSPEETPPSTPQFSRVITKREKDFVALEAAIVKSQTLCSRISQHMGWIKEEKSFFCCGTKVTDNAPAAELRGLQNQLQSMNALLASLKNEN